jgi:hypothetical protein
MKTSINKYISSLVLVPFLSFCILKKGKDEDDSKILLLLLSELLKEKELEENYILQPNNKERSVNFTSKNAGLSLPDFVYSAGKMIEEFSIKNSSGTDVDILKKLKPGRYTVTIKVSTYISLEMRVELDHSNGTQTFSQTSSPISEKEYLYQFSNTNFKSKLLTFQIPFEIPSDRGEYPFLSLSARQMGFAEGVFTQTPFSNNLKNISINGRRLKLQIDAPFANFKPVDSSSSILNQSEKEKAQRIVGSIVNSVSLEEVNSKGTRKTIPLVEQNKFPSLWPGVSYRLDLKFLAYKEIEDAMLEVFYQDGSATNFSRFASLHKFEVPVSDRITLGDTNIQGYQATFNFKIPEDRFGNATIGIRVKEKGSLGYVFVQFSPKIASKNICEASGKKFSVVIHNISRILHPIAQSDRMSIIPDFAFGDQNKHGFHKGTDIEVTTARTVNARSVCDGTVVHVQPTSQYSTEQDKYWNAFVIVKHTCNGLNFFAYYGHVYSQVSLNQKILRGQTIGSIRVLSGIDKHLHFGITPATQDWIRQGWGYAKPEFEACRTSFVNEKWIDANTILFLED